MSYVSVYAHFSLKEKPEGYLGLTSEQWNFGKEIPLTFAELAYQVVHRLAEFSFATDAAVSIEQLNEQIQLLAEQLAASGMRVSPAGNEEDPE